MEKLKLVRNQPENEEEGILMRNVDLARQRLIRRGGELEVLLRERSMSRKDRTRALNYTMSGLDAAHAELRHAVSDLTAFGCDDGASETNGHHA